MSEYTFLQSGDGTYVRKCYGFETSMATMSDLHDGTSHMTYSVHIETIKPVSQDEMASTARSAWTRLRHQVPLIGATTKGSATPEGAFIFEYTTPQNAEAAAVWAQRTVVVAETAAPSLFVRHRDLARNRSWTPSTPHDNAELHVCAIEVGGWVLSITAGHHVIDGRISLALLDELLVHFDAVLRGAAIPLEEIAWGEEITRLPPAAAIIFAEGKVSPPPPTGPMPGLSQLMPFLIPRKTKAEVAYSVKLTVAATAAFHAATKRVQGTVTHAITALCMLAFTETELHMAARAGPAQFSAAAGAYRTTQSFLLPSCPIDQRQKLPNEYRDLRAAYSTPLMALDESPVFVPMASLKQLVAVDPATGTVTLEWQSEVFDQLICDVGAALRSIDDSPTAFVAREAARQKADHIAAFDAAIHVPLLATVSSLGDTTRLGRFQRFVPGNSGDAVLVLVDFLGGARSSSAFTVVGTYQHAGELRVHLCGGGGPMGSRALCELVRTLKNVIAKFVKLPESNVLDIGIDV
ncbi:hypothetical protein FISHEDRAFT_76236 [Fistulina hepatica ATCC 64428]|uniref:CoA-dependent acyltransferase n=1 Tax=Fistulina hepatica ATCC 64428 TaxID=1128425 RepID=A0A0D7A3R6_9AGAR|nr:hypothetical protein FISHEDRAFT_76236 [Fistulina hepatica ATCC 64428]